MFVLGALLMFSDTHPPQHADGVLYALGSGVLASGAGYSLWYGVVRHMSAQQAATLQLSVPVLAALGGVGLALLPRRG